MKKTVAIGAAAIVSTFVPFITALLFVPWLVLSILIVLIFLGASWTAGDIIRMEWHNRRSEHYLYCDCFKDKA